MNYTSMIITGISVIAGFIALLIFKDLSVILVDCLFTKLIKEVICS